MVITVHMPINISAAELESLALIKAYIHTKTPGRYLGAPTMSSCLLPFETSLLVRFQ